MFAQQTPRSYIVGIKMIVPLEIQELPTAETVASVDELLAHLMTADIPGFAIHNAWDTNSQAVTELTPTLLAHGLEVDGSPELFSHEKPPKLMRFVPEAYRVSPLHPGRRFSDKTPLHADGLPGEGQQVEGVRIHTTESGITEAVFYDLTELAIRRYFEIPDIKRAINSDLTMPLSKDSYSRLSEGLVDDEDLVPIRYTTTSRPRTTIFFRALGRRPLVHGFVSRELPRVSHASLASVSQKSRVSKDSALVTL